MTPQRRRLPHVYPPGADLFITWNLHGALPPSFPVRPSKLSGGEPFAWMDRHLDLARNGPMYLRQPAVARIVIDSIHRGATLDHHELHACVVMANHVHLLIRPLVYPSRLLKAVKGSTAREANRILGRTGEPFWQKESFDRWVRDREELARILAYIVNNPVKPGS